jgi:hypothetical protein
MKYLKLLLVVAVVGIQIAAFAFSPENGDKVTVCHMPPGNPENVQEIEVSENAVDAHLEHGDKVGHCTSPVLLYDGDTRPF